MTLTAFERLLDLKNVIVLLWVKLRDGVGGSYELEGLNFQDA